MQFKPKQPLDEIEQSHPTLSASTAKGSVPVNPWLAVFLVLAIYLGSMIVGQIILTVYASARGWSSSQIDHWFSGTYAQFFYVLIVESITVAALYGFTRAIKLPLSRLGLIRPRLTDAGIALIAYGPYFVLNAVLTLLATALFHLNTDQPQQLGFDSVHSGLQMAATFISLVILPPLVEELIMRGFLFTSLRSKLPVVWAALITSLLFAAAHLEIGSGAPLLWVAAIDTFVLSLTLCYLRYRTGSLWPGICLHAFKNLLAFIVIYNVVPHLYGWL